MLLGVAFFVVIWLVTRVTGDYLVSSRVEKEMAVVDAIALEVAPLLYSSDSNGLFSLLVQRGQENGGRVMVIGNRGTVLADGHSTLIGKQMDAAEVQDILSGQYDRAYGFHALEPEWGKEWAGYFTASIYSGTDRMGVLLFSVSIQNMVDQLSTMRLTLLFYFLIVMALVVWVGAAFSRIITRPINELTRVITTTARGDFSERVTVKGSDELARLGTTFNMMSERLEHQDGMRNDFISNVSHELKTPLSAMKILIESLIHQKVLDPDITREFLGDVDDEIDRLNNIVSDLLLLVRSDSGAMELHKKPMELRTMVSDTLKRLAPVADKAQVALHMGKGSPIVVEGDYGKLQQVVYNLVDNAIKYTQQGGHVQVEVQRVGRQALVTVQDDGIGMSPEAQAHVFDRFYRVDKARSRATGGTGLGMSIARTFAVQHGGELSVQSEEDEGSVFTLALPLPGQEAKQDE